MKILVARSSWNTITEELDRVAPREGVLLPLVALELHHENPCATIGLRDLAALVLAEVRCVPRHLQINSVAHVAALPSSDAWADETVLPLTRRYPRLRPAAYLHSHPFAVARTWPSSGDIDGHMRPLLARNADASLAASFSFIACTAFDGGWHLPCFAMDARQRVVELGNAEVVDDDHASIVRARQQRVSRFLVRRWKRQLERHGIEFCEDELFDGWLRFKIRITPTQMLVVLLPVDVPATPPRYHLIDLSTHQARQLDLTFSLEAAEVVSLCRAEAA